MVKINTKYMTRNDCYVANKQITVTKLVLHSTATKGVMAYAWFSRWNKSYLKGEINRQVCVHGFVDNKEAWQYLPWNHRGWHGGGSSNNFAIGIEMCEDTYHTKSFCDATVKNAAELFAFLCKEFNLDPLKDIISHKEGYKLGVCSNHGDPEHWITKHGYTMDKFRKMVYDIMNPPKPVEAPKPVATVVAKVGDILKTTANLNMRSGDSTTHSIILTIPEGTVVEYVATAPSGWFKVKYNGKTGFVSNKFIAVTPAPKVEPIMYRVIIDGDQKMALSTLEKAKEAVQELTPIGKTGIVERDSDKKVLFTFTVKPLETWQIHINGAEVVALQNAVNKYFGDKRLTADGFYGDGTYNGVPNGIRKGMKGYAIIGEIQKRLKALGFYTGAIDSSFGSGTETAVIKLQKARGFSIHDQDGIVGRLTFSELYKK